MSIKWKSSFLVYLPDCLNFQKGNDLIYFCLILVPFNLLPGQDRGGFCLKVLKVITFKYLHDRKYLEVKEYGILSLIVNGELEFPFFLG